jgi:hypothetical protein
VTCAIFENGIVLSFLAGRPVPWWFFSFAAALEARRRRAQPSMLIELFIHSLPRENGREGYEEFEKTFKSEKRTQPAGERLLF